jgi:hypothetical protein
MVLRACESRVCREEGPREGGEIAAATQDLPPTLKEEARRARENAQRDKKRRSTHKEQTTENK